VTDDEERRARRSEALAAARDAGRDEDQEGDEETNRGPESREPRRHRENRSERQADAERQADDRQRHRGDDQRQHRQDDRGRQRRGEDRRRDEGRRRDGNGRRDNERERDGGERRDNERERNEDERQSGGQTAVERVSAVDHDAALVTAFEHDGYDCELGRVGDDFFGFVRVPPDHDRLHLMWELDVPGEFGYGPDADGWVGFDTRPVDRELSPREAAMALAGLAAQVAERSRSVPN
jgi:hypothetical protein